MSTPTPALVTQRAAQRLPRVPLLLLCAAYVLPGVFGRDPWRNADLSAFSIMLGMAEGRLSWLAPTPVGGMADAALLPHWLGALAIQALGGWLGPALAARLPFALLLAATLALVWYATYYLARTEAAQPVAFAFGGEAEPRDYARALADGALLALIACLGLLQLGHETTPELAQLSEVALLLFALAVATTRPLLGRLLAPLALVALASSGAPAIATLMGLVALVTSARSRFEGVRALLPWLAMGAAASAALALLLHTWHWRIVRPDSLADLWALVRLPGWFLWPAWPLALWTLWRWRGHLQSRHIAVPLGCALVALLAMAAMDGNDRVLLLALPGVAVLAAFALPTLDRGASAAIDWFSVFFFTGAAIVGWVVYASMHWGVPAKPLANIQRLAPGFVPQFSWLALLAAVLGTLAWLWLVRWRTARHRDPLWKSLVLPASGVALAWLLSMTLWLPALDYARSLRPLVQQITEIVPAGQCLLAPGLPRTQVAALEVFGRYRVDARTDGPCDAMVLQGRRPGVAPAIDGWRLVATLRRPTDRQEQTWVLRRER
ncbi:hypothetical protein KAK07_05045 [Ideonella sp. 4Y16]|uniref:Glycosyltransferase n=1 Tax=Ideonella alba TaxID=2824118 RepID=A0A940YAD7_9BURK|nr:hypothetical protein [Ideonella alba]MBQ0932902.1 hypothetical protein [Ideonella alba]MBQ0942691.1 hypothetical protein [Ideonella alba]